MNLTQVGFIVLGALILSCSGFGIWKPRQLLEWTERQFVYARIRISMGVLLILLGLTPWIFLLENPAWQQIILLVFASMLLLKGILMLSLPQIIRHNILVIAELDDKIVRYIFVGSSVLALVLIVLGMTV